MHTVDVNCSVLHAIKWQSPAFRDSLETTVYVWKASLDKPVTEQYRQWLQPAEREKALRYSRPESRQQFVFSRGILRELLSHYLSVNPHQLQLFTCPNGKPYCNTPANKSIYFNLSHSGGKLLIAISGSETGIDIEKIKPSFQFNDIASTVFAPEERALLQRTADPRLVFYQLWTRKEALLKATSIGLIDTLPEVRCMPGTNKVAAETIKSSNNWQIQSFSVDEDYLGSVATAPGVAVEFYDYNWLSPPGQEPLAD